MKDKREKLFSLPGVVGYGYGKKITQGRPTEVEALVVFVEKKLPPAELKDEEFIPYAINDTPTDLIEIGKVIALNQIEKKAVNLKECEVLYRLLLECLGKGAAKPEKLDSLQEIANVVKDDLDKLFMLKRAFAKINLADYKSAVGSLTPIQDLLGNLNKDLNKIVLLTNTLSDINLRVYKNALKSLGIGSAESNLADKIQEKVEFFKKLINLFTKPQVDRTSLVRPAPPGVSISHYQGSAGTLGAVVYDRKNNSPLILSNNHVLANTSLVGRPQAKENDAIVQPGNSDGKNEVIGKLVKFVPLNPYPKSNVVDCAVAKPLNNRAITPEILEIGLVKGISDPIIGQKIKKSGRTTGLTVGEVRAVDAKIKVNYGEGVTLLFANQIVATAMSKAGDSGSLVLDENNKAVGLLFAGSNLSTIINPIEPVLDSLGVQF
jgi:hypothetical protein